MERSIQRRRILERLDHDAAKLIALIAPAGFGKTTLALQIAARSEVTTICDCAAAETEIDLAREIVAALARESPEQTASLIGCFLNITADTVMLDRSRALLLGAWQHPSRRASFIVENAEKLLVIPGAIRLISELLAQLPDERTLIICSRVALPLNFSRFVPDADIVILHALDLTFDDIEFGQLCRLNGIVDEPTVALAAQSSRGWPIASAALLRMAREGRLVEMIDRVDVVAAEGLHDYLVNDVLATLTPDQLDALVKCALLPAANVADVADACGMSALALHEVIEPVPFLERRRAGDLDLHPLVRAVLSRVYAAQKRPILRKLAALREREGRFLDAARLHLASGDRLAAAKALDRIDSLEVPATSIECARIVASLDRSIITRFPRLWSTSILYGRFSLDPHLAVGEAQALLRTLDSSVPISVRSCVVRPLASYLSRLGMHDAGYRMIRELESETRIADAPHTFDQAAVIYIRAMIAGRRGWVREFEEQAERAWPFAAKHDGMATLLQVERAAEVLRVTGRRFEEVRVLDEALARAGRSGITVNLGFALAEACFGAWFSGDDVLFAKYLTRLESVVEQFAVHGFTHFVDCARGRFTPSASSSAFPKWAACAHLVAIPALDEPAARGACAVAALEFAQEYAGPFILMLAYIAVAETLPERRSDACAHILDLASRVESPALQAAANALVSGESDVGMLTAFVLRLRTKRLKSSALLVELLTGNVVRGTEHIRLSDGKMQLLFALARQRSSLSRAQLLDLLWPSAGERAAHNALNLCLHHVRRLLGENAIVRVGGGYRLGDDVRVDLREIESELAAQPVGGRYDVVERARLLSMYRRLRSAPSPLREWEWFEPTQRRIDLLRCKFADRLAHDALGAGDPQLALEFAYDVIEYDECDEPAREIAIRAHLALGDEAEAFREFRRYREIVARELGACPSLSLERLVANANVDATISRSAQSRARTS